MSIIEPFHINAKFRLTHFGIQLVAIWQVEVDVTDWFHFQMYMYQQEHMNAPAIIATSEGSRDTRCTRCPEYPCYDEAEGLGKRVKFSRLWVESITLTIIHGIQRSLKRIRLQNAGRG